MKFIFSSLFSFIIDIVLFTILNTLLKGLIPTNYIIVATVLARLVSSTVNYVINKNNVFAKNDKPSDKKYDSKSLVKYAMLAFVQVGLSAFLVSTLFTYNTFLNETVIKILVDSFLFLLSFNIQRKWVFKPNKTKGDN